MDEFEEIINTNLELKLTSRFSQYQNENKTQKFDNFIWKEFHMLESLYGKGR